MLSTMFVDAPPTPETAVRQRRKGPRRGYRAVTPWLQGAVLYVAKPWEIWPAERLQSATKPRVPLVLRDGTRENAVYLVTPLSTREVCSLPRTAGVAGEYNSKGSYDGWWFRVLDAGHVVTAADGNDVGCSNRQEGDATQCAADEGVYHIRQRAHPLSSRPVNACGSSSKEVLHPLKGTLKMHNADINIDNENDESTACRQKLIPTPSAMPAVIRPSPFKMTKQEAHADEQDARTSSSKISRDPERSLALSAALSGYRLRPLGFCENSDLCRRLFPDGKWRRPMGLSLEFPKEVYLSGGIPEDWNMPAKDASATRATTDLPSSSPSSPSASLSLSSSPNLVKRASSGQSPDDDHTGSDIAGIDKKAKPRQWHPVWDKRGWDVVALHSIDAEGFDAENRFHITLLNEWRNLKIGDMCRGRYTSDWGRDRSASVFRKSVVFRKWPRGDDASRRRKRKLREKEREKEMVAGVNGEVQSRMHTAGADTARNGVSLSPSSSMAADSNHADNGDGDYRRYVDEGGRYIGREDGEQEGRGCGSKRRLREASGGYGDYSNEASRKRRRRSPTTTTAMSEIADSRERDVGENGELALHRTESSPVKKILDKNTDKEVTVVDTIITTSTVNVSDDGNGFQRRHLRRRGRQLEDNDEQAERLLAEMDAQLATGILMKQLVGQGGGTWRTDAGLMDPRTFVRMAVNGNVKRSRSPPSAAGDKGHDSSATPASRSGQEVAIESDVTAGGVGRQLVTVSSDRTVRTRMARGAGKVDKDDAAAARRYRDGDEGNDDDDDGAAAEGRHMFAVFDRDGSKKFDFEAFRLFSEETFSRFLRTFAYAEDPERVERMIVDQIHLATCAPTIFWNLAFRGALDIAAAVRRLVPETKSVGISGRLKRRVQPPRDHLPTFAVSKTLSASSVANETDNVKPPTKRPGARKSAPAAPSRQELEHAVFLALSKQAIERTTLYYSRPRRDFVSWTPARQEALIQKNAQTIHSPSPSAGSATPANGKASWPPVRGASRRSSHSASGVETPNDETPSGVVGGGQRHRNSTSAVTTGTENVNPQGRIRRERIPILPNDAEALITTYFDLEGFPARGLDHLSQMQRKLLYAECCVRDFSAPLELRIIPQKGRGVFASAKIRREDFVCEYKGVLYGLRDAKEREKLHEMRGDGSFMYYFPDQSSRTCCIDATEECPEFGFGRLVNHSRKNPNLVPVATCVGHEPRLVFVAKREIDEGEELLIDYGETDETALLRNPWLRE